MKITLSAPSYGTMSRELLYTMKNVLFANDTSRGDEIVLINGRHIAEEEIQSTANEDVIPVIKFIPTVLVNSVCITRNWILPPKDGQTEHRIRRVVHFYLRDTTSQVTVDKPEWGRFLLIDCGDTFGESDEAGIKSLSMRELLLNRANKLNVEKICDETGVAEFIRHVESHGKDDRFFSDEDDHVTCERLKDGFQQVDDLLNGWVALKAKTRLSNVPDWIWLNQMLAQMPLHKFCRTWSKYMVNQIVGEPFYPCM